MIQNFTFTRRYRYLVFNIGIAGAGILYGVTPKKWRGNLGLNIKDDDISVEQALGVEAMLTFLLALTVYSAYDTNRKINDYGLSPILIGAAYIAVHFMGVSVKMKF